MAADSLRGICSQSVPPSFLSIANIVSPIQSTSCRSSYVRNTFSRSLLAAQNASIIPNLRLNVGRDRGELHRRMGFGKESSEVGKIKSAGTRPRETLVKRAFARFGIRASPSSPPLSPRTKPADGNEVAATYWPGRKAISGEASTPSTSVEHLTQRRREAGSAESTWSFGNTTSHGDTGGL